MIQNGGPRSFEIRQIPIPENEGSFSDNGVEARF
jgi:hypothetical protein